MKKILLSSFLFVALNIVTSSCTKADATKGDTATQAKEQTATESQANEADANPKPEKDLNPYFNNQKADTDKINEVMGKISGITDLNQRVVAAANEFLGTPYVGGTLSVPEEEQLYVNTTGLDCLTFVESIISLAVASGKDNPGINDFLQTLQSVRYRNGEIDGYPSRLHYISEWGIDNGRRGNFREISHEYGGSQKRVKTINFMTSNRSLYPALSDNAVFEAVRKSELPLKDLQFSFIPTSEVGKAGDFLKSGDIVAIVTDKPGLDVSHVGIVNVKKGVPHMIHASSKYKKVIDDPLPLQEYLQRQKSPGIRVFRLLTPH